MRLILMLTAKKIVAPHLWIQELNAIVQALIPRQIPETNHG